MNGYYTKEYIESLGFKYHSEQPGGWGTYSTYRFVIDGEPRVAKFILEITGLDMEEFVTHINFKLMKFEYYSSLDVGLNISNIIGNLQVLLQCHALSKAEFEYLLTKATYYDYLDLNTERRKAEENLILFLQEVHKADDEFLNKNKMTDKYYTPDISEFYVGFECEIQSSYEWQKGMWPKILFQDSVAWNDTLAAGKVAGTENTCFRVKYLDREDIENLGFKYDEDEPSVLAFVKGIWDLWYNTITKFLIIESEETGIVFKGTIKNKSELIKLLKQLGIK